MAKNKVAPVWWLIIVITISWALCLIGILWQIVVWVTT